MTAELITLIALFVILPVAAVAFIATVVKL